MDGRNTNINSQSLSGAGRRRGHQHHIRQTGTRASNVDADEILAALRKGDQIPVCAKSPLDDDMNGRDEYMINEEKCQNDDLIHSRTTSEQNANRNAGDCDCLKTKRTSLEPSNIATSLEPRQLCDSTVIKQYEENLTVGETNDRKKNYSEGIDTLASDMNMKKTFERFSSEPISSGNIGKTKSKRNKKNQTMQIDSESNAKEMHFKKLKQSPPMGERPPLEGADCDHWTENSSMDIENDPEAAEWSKLRCTSERAEVIAEREYRRQNRRCADYPGLAFGRSIFSSDTMMKLNIIRNELHNIMKTQLKRVRFLDDVAA